MKFSGENRVLAVLLVSVPATLISVWLHWPTWFQFFLSVAAVIPLAGFIGTATEELADRVGARTGGLLNATFGNAPDFLIGFFGIQRNLIPLVKATLIGALISNSALIMGVCYIAAGLIHGKPRFRRAEAGHHSVLMLLTVAAVLFPTAGALAVCGGSQCSGTAGQQVQYLSIGVAAALLVAYAGYVVFSIFGFEAWGRPRAVAIPQEGCPGHLAHLAVGGGAGGGDGAADTGRRHLDRHGRRGHEGARLDRRLRRHRGGGQCGQRCRGLRRHQRRHPAPGKPGRGGEDSGLDLALGIASASSIQIATLILPLVVLRASSSTR